MEGGILPRPPTFLLRLLGILCPWPAVVLPSILLVEAVRFLRSRRPSCLGSATEQLLAYPSTPCHPSRRFTPAGGAYLSVLGMEGMDNVAAGLSVLSSRDWGIG